MAAGHMDHRDMNITNRYVHPQEQTIRAAMDRTEAANGGHTAQELDFESMPVSAPKILT